MRELREVPVLDALGLLSQLREALAGRGPALLPRPAAIPAENPAAALRPSPAATGIDGIVVPHEVALVIETSGSTARPKRVMLSGAALRCAAQATHQFLAELDGDEPGGEQWLLCLPAHYIAGAQILVRGIVAGTTPVVMPERFSVDAVLDAAARMTGRRRYVSFVPVLLRRLLDAADTRRDVAAALARFDAILVGGQATAPQLLERAAAHGWRCVTTYGSSETCGGAAYSGHPLPGVRIRESGGELLIASDSLALGYLNDPERTAAAFVERDGERWYRTGDAGEVFSDGRIRVSGRRDSIIISGGIKVNLDEVTAAASAAGVFPEVIAVPLSDEQWGQRVALLASDAQVSAPTRDQLQPRGDSREAHRDAPGGGSEAWAAVLERLNPFGPAGKPALLLRIPSFPRLASGKPDRLALTDLAAQFHVEHTSLAARTDRTE